MDLLIRHLLFIASIVFTSFLILNGPGHLLAQEAQPAEEEKDLAEDLVEFMEESMQEIDFYSLEELLDVEVEVASLFLEDELVVGSSVSSITPEKWKKLGARRNHEALNNEMGIQSFPAILGFYDVAIRGYKGSASSAGISYMLDGVQLNDFITGAIYQVPNWELGTLDRIEVIKGPGSAIYGSYAFHGVLSMRTFESDKDMYYVEGAAVYPNPEYYDGNIKLSKGFFENFLRVDMAAAASRQRDLEQEYIYNDNGREGKGIHDGNHDSQIGVIKLRVNPGEKLNARFSGYVSRFRADGYPGVGVSPLGSLEDADVSGADCLYLLGKGEISYEFWDKISVDAMANYTLIQAEQRISMSPLGLWNVKTQDGNMGEAKIVIKQPDNPLNLQWLLAYDCQYLDRLSATTKVENDNGNAISGFEKSDELFNGFTRKINSLFGQAKWGAIKDTLFILAGARMDHYSDFGSQYTPRGGLIVLPTRNSSVKALYGRGFRAPLGAELEGMKDLTRPNPDLEPETIDEYELIYIYKEKNWKASVSGFYSFWKDAIISVMLPDDPDNYQITYINQGENQAYGGEVNLYYTFSFPVSIEMGFAYVKSMALDVEATDDDGNLLRDEDGSVITEDVEFSCFPEYSGNIAINYILKPYEVSFYLNNRVYLERTGYPATPTSDPDKLSPYYRMDLNISKIISGSLEIILDIRNVFNRENEIPMTSGRHGYFIEQGTSVSLRAGLKF